MRDDPALVADVGGTNIRMAIATADGLQASQSWQCADFDTIEEALRKYLDGSEAETLPRRAAIAVACPVEGDQIDITNQSWSFSIEQLRQALQLEELRVINDFTALGPRFHASEPRTRRSSRGGGRWGGRPSPCSDPAPVSESPG